jgi:pimeloyl-ACP methyl ester carboxylesterase
VDEFVVQRSDRRLVVSVRGEGPPLFFAHGLSGTHLDAAWISGPADGFRVITPDLFGRGQSFPAPSIEGQSFDEHAADVSAILDHLGADDAVVGGVSFGAAVAVAFAVRYPARVRGLFLLASAFGSQHEAMGEGDLERYGVLGARMGAEGVRAVAESEAARIGSTRPIERWTQHDEESIVAWMRAVPRYRPFESVSDLERVTAPTLVVAGNDDIHRLELSEAYAAALPDAMLVGSSARLPEVVGRFLDGFRDRV